jgi:quinol-cytochrome oxidoreductase complex cytochrome b subunit
MNRRTRKLVGTIAIVAFIAFYALFSMAMLQSRIAEAPKWIQTCVYAFLGIAWVLPIMPLIKWMENRRAGED